MSVKGYHSLKNQKRFQMQWCLVMGYEVYEFIE